jgi:cell division protein FtsW (lipid II flippase)
MHPLMNFNLKKYDLKMFFLICAAAVFGVLMVFSSSGVKSYSPMFKQLLCAIIGCALMFATAFLIDYKFYQKHADCDLNIRIKHLTVVRIPKR